MSTEQRLAALEEKNAALESEIKEIKKRLDETEKVAYEALRRVQNLENIGRESSAYVQEFVFGRTKKLAKNAYDFLMRVRDFDRTLTDDVPNYLSEAQNSDKKRSNSTKTIQ